MLCININDELKKRKIKRPELIKDLIANGEFMKKNRTNQMILINKLKSINAPKYHDRKERAMNLFQKCLEANNFSLFNHIDYVCDIISDGATELFIHSSKFSNKYQPSKIVSFTKFQLKKYDPKLCERIEKLNYQIDENAKIILGLTTRLLGISHWQQNNLFPNTDKLVYQGRTVYYAIVRREEKINASTYFYINNF